MAECIEEGKLRAYADGVLTPEQEAAVSAHLAHCEACKGSVAELDMLTSEVASLVTDGSPLPNPQMALARLRSTLAKPTDYARIAAPPTVVPTLQPQRFRAYSRPMPMRPVAMGIGLGAAVVAVLLSIFLIGGYRNTASKPTSEFVPKGMVRHVTVSHTFTTTVEGQAGSILIEEVWLTNGKNHLLRYSNSPSTGGVTWAGGETWVEEDSVYFYNPSISNKSVANSKTVFKYPYDPRHLELYVPNEISYLLTIPNAKIVGDAILDGRPVTVIEAIADKVNPTPEVVYSLEGVVHAVTDYKLWVDKDTSQVLQREHKSTFLDGSIKGKTQTQTFKVTANELKDASQVPADLFKFKLPAGARVVEAPSPFGAMPTPGVVDGKKPTPSFPTGIGESIIQSRWISKEGTRESRWEVLPIDPATGKAVPGYEPFVISKNTDFTGQIQLSPNGTRLAVTEVRKPVSWPWGGGSNTMGSADLLHLIDLQTWREVTATLSSNQAVVLLAFSDDSRHLALDLRQYLYDPNRLEDELVLVDATNGRISARRKLEINPSHIAFSADGSRLVVFGQRYGANPGTDKPGPLRVMLLDRASLKTLWEHTLDGIVGGYWCESNSDAPYDQKVFASWQPAVTFSPDRDKLYIVHADADKLTTIDFAAQKVNLVDIVGAKSWLETLLDATASKAEAKANINGADKSAVLSADGTQLYVAGYEMDAKRDPEAKSLGLQVIDLKSGRLVASIESDLGGLRVYYAGNQIFLSGLRDEVQVTDVLDDATLKRITTIENWRVIPVRRLNGQPIILANRRIGDQTEYGLMDPQTFKVTQTWSSPRNMGIVARGDR